MTQAYTPNPNTAPAEPEARQALSLREKAERAVYYGGAIVAAAGGVVLAYASVDHIMSAPAAAEQGDYETAYREQRSVAKRLGYGFGGMIAGAGASISAVGSADRRRSQEGGGGDMAASGQLYDGPPNTFDEAPDAGVDLSRQVEVPLTPPLAITMDQPDRPDGDAAFRPQSPANTPFLPPRQTNTNLNGGI